MDIIENMKHIIQSWNFDSIVEHIIINYRWVFVMFLLPVSFFYDMYFAMRSFIIFKLNSAPQKHLEKVRNIQNQIKEWRDSGMLKPMCTARPGNQITLMVKWCIHFLYVLTIIWALHHFTYTIYYRRMANHFASKYGVQISNA